MMELRDLIAHAVMADLNVPECIGMLDDYRETADAIIALLDRIEELEASNKTLPETNVVPAYVMTQRDEARAEALEQARLLGMGADRELRLMAERDEAREAVKRLAAALDKLVELHAMDAEKMPMLRWFSDVEIGKRASMADTTIADPVVKRIVEGE